MDILSLNPSFTDRYITGLLKEALVENQVRVTYHTHTHTH